MKYDVFLASALEDVEMADMVARRLKALKMKVWFDKKRADRTAEETFDSKDAKAVEDSRAMVVLWSQSADLSDWVHSAARAGRSRDLDEDVAFDLIQTALDDVVPRDPFGLDGRFQLEGLTARKTVAGWEQTVDALGGALDRPGLVEWMGFKTADTEAKAAWLAAHASDPLAGTAVPKKPERKKPWPSKWDPSTAAGLPYGVWDDLELIGGVGEGQALRLRAEGAGSLEDIATLTRADAEKLEKKADLRTGTIERGEWVMQARELLDGQEPRARVDRDDWRLMQLNALKTLHVNRELEGSAPDPASDSESGSTPAVAAAAGATALAATAVATGWRGEWKPSYGLRYLPDGVVDDVILVGGITEGNVDKVRGAGFTSLTQIVSLDDDEMSDLEHRLDFPAGRINDMEWREQADELLMGKAPRAQTDIDLWNRMQAGDYVAATASGLGAGAVLTSTAIAEPVEAPEPARVHAEPAMAYAPPVQQDGIRIGTIAAILTLIGLMLVAGWLFGRDERSRAADLSALASGAVKTCPVGYYPAASTPLSTGPIINDTDG